jgi:hypothetical protein
MLPLPDGVIFVQTSPNGTHESLSPVADIDEVEYCPSPSVTECRYCCQTKLDGCECDEEEEDPNETTSGSGSEYVSEEESNEEEMYLPDPPSMQRHDSYLDPGVRRFSYRMED